jgi:ribosome recycling factor
MTPERRAALLKALRKDLEQTRKTVEFLRQQREHEEAMYWETGIWRDVTRSEAEQVRQDSGLMLTQHEETLQAFFAATDGQKK